MKRRFVTAGVVLVVVGLALGSLVLAGGIEKSPYHTQSLDPGSPQEVRTSDFILSVEVPEEIRAGEIFTLKGTLKYSGEGEMRFYSQVPAIRFFMLDGDGEYVANDLFDHPRVYTDLAEIIPLEPGWTRTVEDTWRIDYPGEYRLIVTTSKAATGPVKIAVVNVVDG